MPTLRALPVTQPSEPAYTIPELASLWRTSRRTIERLLERGELQAVRVGARRRIPKSAADEYLEAHPGA